MLIVGIAFLIGLICFCSLVFLSNQRDEKMMQKYSQSKFNKLYEKEMEGVFYDKDGWMAKASHTNGTFIVTIFRSKDLFQAPKQWHLSLLSPKKNEFYKFSYYDHMTEPEFMAALNENFTGPIIDEIVRIKEQEKQDAINKARIKSIQLNKSVE